MKTVTLIVVALAALMAYHSYCPQPCSGAWFWERILTPWSHIVDEDKTGITFVWVGRDTYELFHVSRAAVKRSAQESIRKRIECLIGYMESEVRERGWVAGDSYERDLAVLTSVEMEAGPAPWRAWWTQNTSTFVASPSAYEDLEKARIARETKLYGSSEWAESRFRWRQAYLRSRVWRWTALGVAVACLAAAVLVNRDKFRRKRGEQPAGADPAGPEPAQP